jgi:hypothetical protein
MSRWVVLKGRVGAVTSQRVLKVLFYVKILQCFFVVENFTTNAVSVAIGDNGNRLIFEIWWNLDPFSPKYRLSSIICDVASFRLFKPVRSEPVHDNNRKFLHIPFANKGIDAINISNILNRKEVVKEIPVLTQSDKDSNSGSWSPSLFIHLLA